MRPVINGERKSGNQPGGFSARLQGASEAEEGILLSDGSDTLSQPLTIFGDMPQHRNVIPGVNIALDWGLVAYLYGYSANNPGSLAPALDFALPSELVGARERESAGGPAASATWLREARSLPLAKAMTITPSNTTPKPSAERNRSRANRRGLASGSTSAFICKEGLFAAIWVQFNLVL